MIHKKFTKTNKQINNCNKKVAGFATQCVLLDPPPVPAPHRTLLINM